MNFTNIFLIFILLLSLSLSCNKVESEVLPILGNRETLEDGTIKYHSIPSFSFIDQDSLPFTEKSVENKIYVVDFFFISCPSICPMVSRQMLRVYEQYLKEERQQELEVNLLSYFSIAYNENIILGCKFKTKLH